MKITVSGLLYFHTSGKRGNENPIKFTIFVDHLVHRSQSSLFGNISNYSLEVYMVLHSTSYSHIIY